MTDNEEEDLFEMYYSDPTFAERYLEQHQDPDELEKELEAYQEQQEQQRQKLLGDIASVDFLEVDYPSFTTVSVLVESNHPRALQRSLLYLGKVIHSYRCQIEFGFYIDIETVIDGKPYTKIWVTWGERAYGLGNAVKWILARINETGKAPAQDDIESFVLHNCHFEDPPLFPDDNLQLGYSEDVHL